MSVANERAPFALVRAKRRLAKAPTHVAYREVTPPSAERESVMQSRRRNTVKPRQQAARPLRSDRVRGARRVNTMDSRSRTRARLVRWKRRHLNARTVVVLVVLSALLAPEAAMVIDAAL